MKTDDLLETLIREIVKDEINRIQLFELDTEGFAQFSRVGVEKTEVDFDLIKDLKSKITDVVTGIVER